MFNLEFYNIDRYGGKLFVSIEGIDGSGKTTQAKMLTEHMERHNATLLTYEPTSKEIGKLLRKFLRTEKGIDNRTIQLLFVADRSEHVSNVINPALKNGINVVCDRYVLSTIAYGTAAKVDEKWLVAINSCFPVPDATILIDIDPKSAIERITNGKRNKDSEPYFEKIEFLENVSKKYKSLAKKDKNAYIINGLRDRKEVLEDLKLIVDRL